MAETFDPLEQAVLVALAATCRLSMHSHVPVQAVQSKFPKHIRGDVPKSLERLRRRGLCQKHPTGGGITWELTREGLAVARSAMGILPTTRSGEDSPFSNQ
jgi:hypothetical protein